MFPSVNIRSGGDAYQERRLLTCLFNAIGYVWIFSTFWVHGRNDLNGWILSKLASYLRGTGY